MAKAKLARKTSKVKREAAADRHSFDEMICNTTVIVREAKRLAQGGGMTDHHVTMLLLPPCEELTPERATAWLTGDAHGLLRLVVAGFYAPRASRRAFQNLASDLLRMAEACGWALRGASVRVEREHEPGPSGDFGLDAEDLACILASAEGDRSPPCAIVPLAEELAERRAMMRGAG